MKFIHNLTSVFASLKSEFAYKRHDELRVYCFSNWLDGQRIAQCLCQFYQKGVYSICYSIELSVTMQFRFDLEIV